MVPYIILRGDHDGYFPDTDVWATGQQHEPTSGITQPPVAAAIIRRLIEAGVQVSTERLRVSVERLDRWHQWFTCQAMCRQQRDFYCSSMESGRDNLA